LEVAREGHGRDKAFDTGFDLDGGSGEILVASGGIDDEVDLFAAKFIFEDKEEMKAEVTARGEAELFFAVLASFFDQGVITGGAFGEGFCGDKEGSEGGIGFDIGEGEEADAKGEKEDE
jgi:hypothetical protein